MPFANDKIAGDVPISVVGQPRCTESPSWFVRKTYFPLHPRVADQYTGRTAPGRRCCLRRKTDGVQTLAAFGPNRRKSAKAYTPARTIASIAFARNSVSHFPSQSLRLNRTKTRSTLSTACMADTQAHPTAPSLARSVVTVAELVCRRLPKRSII